MTNQMADARVPRRNKGHHHSFTLDEAWGAWSERNTPIQPIQSISARTGRDEGVALTGDNNWDHGLELRDCGLADYGKRMDCYQATNQPQRPADRPTDRPHFQGRRILMSPPPHFAQHDATLSVA